MMLSPPTATFFKSRFHFTVTDCLWCGGPWLTGGGGWHITEAVAQQPCAVARARASHEVCPPCPLSPLPATNIEPIRNIQSRVNRDHPTDIIGGAAFVCVTYQDGILFRFVFLNDVGQKCSNLDFIHIVTMHAMTSWWSYLNYIYDVNHSSFTNFVTWRLSLKGQHFFINHFVPQRGYGYAHDLDQ